MSSIIEKVTNSLNKLKSFGEAPGTLKDRDTLIT